MLSCLWKSAYKRFLAAYWKSSLCGAGGLPLKKCHNNHIDIGLGLNLGLGLGLGLMLGLGLELCLELGLCIWLGLGLG